MRLRKIIAANCVLLVSLFACKKSVNEDSGNGAKLIFKFRFDSTQARLNNIGQPATMPASNAGQSPRFNGMSAHYVEMTPAATTALGQGAVLYRATETSIGGANAIDFSKAIIKKDGEIFLELPLKDVPAGSYEWLRVSLAYQNYEVSFRIDTTISSIPINGMFSGTVASFIGYNSYINSLTVKSKPIPINANRKQGFWGFETTATLAGIVQTITDTGQAPAGATTVPNPIFATSPIPQGSCVVTAAFLPGKLVITGTETKDIVVEVSLSTNKSFEWQDLRKNGVWEPLRGEEVVDMGIRGMIPRWQ
jgi:hypothetical protein